MVAGRELQVAIIAILEKEVIKKLESNTAQVPPGLLIGLRDLVEKSGQTAILRRLFTQVFEQALRQLCDAIFIKKKLN